jgi:hypothetical protein
VEQKRGSQVRTRIYALETVPTGVGGGTGHITGARRSGRGPGVPLCSTYFCLSRYCHYLTIVEINPFRPSQVTVQMRVFPI